MSHVAPRLVDREEEDSDDDSSSFVSERRLPDMSKGFGLSREVLNDAGLRANGRKDDSVGTPLHGGGLRSTVSVGQGLRINVGSRCDGGPIISTIGAILIFHAEFLKRRVDANPMLRLKALLSK
eukprot:s1751_g2.t1